MYVAPTGAYTRFFPGESGEGGGKLILGEKNIFLLNIMAGIYIMQNTIVGGGDGRMGKK